MLAKLIALVLPLGLDTFAVAAAIGMIGVSASERRRISLLFTGFEAGMPVIGLALGAPLGHAIGAAADYVAIGVLIAFGIYTLSSADEDNARLAELTQMRGLRAVALGVSISIDELAIGFTLGLLHISAVLVIALIAVQTLVVTQLGLQLGGRLSERVSGSLGSRWQRSGSFCWPRSSRPDPRVASCRARLHLRGGDEAGTVLNNRSRKRSCRTCSPRNAGKSASRGLRPVAAVNSLVVQVPVGGV
jgi:manganese efflux pump family protein